ncbi:unnamed protein product [Porites evermanni]|uniref:Tr-type G domain-containing protein n=1 Tax=Porites evermanni TaxID=104178 RepID=A0ABN8QJD6_9CNID|nr:unnamed protein product [Porites evermanni]
MESFIHLFETAAGSGAETSRASMPESLPPEVEEGNVEYKLKLVNPSPSRLEHLVTQMKWRLQEGDGEAIYEIGVEDNGMFVGLTREELDSSLNTLNVMASKLGAHTTLLRRHVVESTGSSFAREVAEVFVRRVPDDQKFIDIRLAVLGNVDAGKSTLLGVLTHDELDNGRGRARLNLFRHLHEIQSGRTSSISHEILGFNSKGEVINYSESRTAEDICEQSSKLITFIDLAGHHKYLRTTIFGLTGHSPDFAMLVIAGNAGVVGTTKEHLGLAMALKVPTLVIVNKTDICLPTMVGHTLKVLDRLLKSPGCKKVPVVVETEDDVIVAATNFISNQVTPVFTVSCVTGENLNLIKKFLNLVPPARSAMDQEKLAQELTEYQVDKIFNVPGTGPVVGGTLERGVLREGDQLLLGPSQDGSFHPVTVTSVKRNRAACRVVRAGQAATVAISGMDRNLLRRGMVLADPVQKPRPCYGFWAEVFLLFHTTSISKRFQATVYIGNVIQTAVIEEMNRDSLRTGQRAKVRFKFMKQPEYIREGARVFFREGHTKGVGQVQSVIYHNAVPGR